MEQELFEKRKVAFITEANTDIGYGHLYRSIALAQNFFSNHCDADFFCSGDIPNKIIRENLQKSNVFDISELRKNTQNYNLAILDVYKKSWSNYQWLIQLSGIQTASVIDYAFKEYSIPTDHIFEIGFQEYRFKETISKRENGKISKVYSGNDFFIFREEFKKEITFDVRRDANRILVSMGGSDPYELTELVSESLINIKKPLKITLILGPGITSQRISIIKSIFSISFHDVTIFQSVSNIAKLMVNNDLAIINGGNTRFELATIGIPFISVSFNSTQNNIANHLETYGIGKNLGIFTDLNKETFAESIEQFINNFEIRKIMSERLKENINLKGPQIILNLLNC